MREKRTFVHHALNDLPDSGKSNAVFEKGLDGHLVGGIEDGWQGTSSLSSATRKVERRKIRATRCFEIKPPKRCEIEWTQAVLDALGPSNGILDGKAHIRVAELREQRAVHKFHHGVHDALRVDDHVHLRHGDVE